MKCATATKIKPQEAHLAHTDVHIHPEIPVTGYIPGAMAVDRMIAVGERAAYQALETLSVAQAA